MSLVNTWKVEETFTLGISTNGSDGYTIEFKGDGKVIQTGTMSGFAATGDSEWEWGDKKETIVYLGSEWTILRLTSNEFWVSGASGNFEIHYVSAK
ncbi:MAG TPA: hypothetical protein PKK00_01340 [Bacteroidales bacterium]|nr:hypothetical protein [Bacteroidales bacterium]HPS16039.1 hypothetical protein [Bacteroidales bacterium]